MKLKSCKIFVNPRKRKSLPKNMINRLKDILDKNNICVNEKKFDFAITVGGDGTILFNKHIFPKPVFAIGSHTSKICQADIFNFESKLKKVLKNPAIEKRLMLSAYVNGLFFSNALNDIYIHSYDHRVVRILVNDTELIGDGVIFSTPTGSFAYCYSAGGKKMNISILDKYQVVPIAPYLRKFRPFFVDSNKSVKVQIHDKRTHADLISDGQMQARLKLGDKIEIRKSKIYACFLVSKRKV